MPARRRPTRWLAPLAIVAVAAAGYGIARSASSEDDESSDRPATTRSDRPATTTQRRTPARTGKRTYVVRAGDTLSAIALETGVPVERLEQLNEDLDVQALQPGERLKLRP